ncbi:MAG: ABC transporter permease [Anaerolineales bacterium]|nr:MAG: ABC transporter permease [Anaerolineales bacterium]
MSKSRKILLDIGFQLLGVLLAVLFTTLILLFTGAPPLQTYKLIITGAFSSLNSISNDFVVWVPLILATVGLLVTFSAGLWNIGIEGQITLGAIFTTGLIRMLLDTSVPPLLIIFLSILAGMLGGAIWATLAGALKTFGGVNEIFGGLGLNFVATAFTLWLIFGPWQRPGVGSMSGTEPFPESLWLPQLPGLRMSLWSLLLGILAVVIIYMMLRSTYFGLKLKAVGKNIRAAFLLGVPTWQYMMLSFIVCGLFAGLAGAIQVVAVYHRLIPSISSGYGFLGLLVAMLVNYQAIWAAFIAFFYAALNIGAIQLPIVLKLDSTLSGILQGMLVLFVLIVDGVRQRLLKKRV